MLRSQHVQAAQLHYLFVLLLPVRAVGVAAPQYDVGSPTRHVSGDGYPADSAGLRNDRRFVFVVLGIQDLMRHSPAVQPFTELFRRLNGSGAYQHRSSRVVHFHNIFYHGAPPRLAGLKDQVWMPLPHHGKVGGHHRDFQLVYLVKLVCLGGGGSGHARQFAVHTEVVLQGNGGVGDALPLDLYPLLSLNSLVQAVGPAAAGLEPPRKFVDNHHLAVLDHVLYVPFFLHVGGQRVFHKVNQVDIFRVVQVAHVGPLLHLGDAFRSHGDGLGPFVYGIVLLQPQTGRQFGKGVVMLNRLFGRPADDQGGPSFVDQDVVHLVDYGVVELSLHLVGYLNRHVVPQVIKTELIVGAVQNVGVVSLRAVDGTERH